MVPAMYWIVEGIKERFRKKTKTTAKLAIEELVEKEVEA
jgi:hypothetical protein